MRQSLPRYRGPAAVPGITSDCSLPRPSQAKPASGLTNRAASSKASGRAALPLTITPRPVSFHQP
ncbi:hypothetical protein GGI43DRAFT_404790 [Trichoderma evansii]